MNRNHFILFIYRIIQHKQAQKICFFVRIVSCGFVHYFVCGDVKCKQRYKQQQNEILNIIVLTENEI